MAEQILEPLLAKAELGVLAREEVRRMAVELLVEGLDAPSLRRAVDAARAAA